MRRQRHPLVCQHVEDLSSAALEKYAGIIRAIVGRRFGVYALYRKGELYYVGLAINLRNRLKHHLRDRHKGLWDRFSVYLTIEHGHIKELESLVIRIAQPKGNKQSGKFARSENLKRDLKRRFKAHDDALRNAIIGLDEAAAEEECDEVPIRPKRGGRRPAVADYIARSMNLRKTYKGKTYKARIRKDGSIRFGGKVFATPSLAGKAVTGRSVNGWSFWRYEKAPGLWVRLRELRRK